jgi:hypothetical protein
MHLWKMEIYQTSIVSGAITPDIQQHFKTQANVSETGCCTEHVIAYW